MMSNLDVQNAKAKARFLKYKKDKLPYKLYPCLVRNKVYTIYIPSKKPSLLKINFGYPADFVRRNNPYDRLRWRKVVEEKYPDSLKNELTPIFWTYNLIYSEESDVHKALRDYIAKKEGTEMKQIKV